jgi:hypothetical protein
MGSGLWFRSIIGIKRVKDDRSKQAKVNMQSDELIKSFHSCFLQHGFVLITTTTFPQTTLMVVEYIYIGTLQVEGAFP